MKLQHKILSTFCIFFCLFANGQNLVPNPSFEYTVSCPTSIGQINKCQSWINPTQGTPDYFNACSTANGNAVHVPNNAFGTQSANTGVAYAGFYTFDKANPDTFREYIQINLTTTLIPSHKYLVSFYLNLSDASQYALSCIGAYFSANAVSQVGAGVFNHIPQILNKSSNILSNKTNWMLVSDTLYSNGTEQYITIGNFNHSSQSDTVFLGNIGGGNDAYYYIDDVSIIDEGIYTGIKQFTDNIKQLLVYPNPSTGRVYVSGFDGNQKTAVIEITDVTGKLIYKQQNNLSNGMVELNLPFANGVYFVHAVNQSGVMQIQKLVITN